MLRPLALTAALAAVLLAVAGCGSPEPPETVEVVFQDSSVPPEFHRSWTLEADGGDLSVVVDSYGDVVSEGSATMDDRAWEEFTSGLQEQLDAVDTPLFGGGDDGCSGGQQITITLPDKTYEFETQCGEDDEQQPVREALEILAPLTEAVDLERLRSQELQP